jgi:hypothetical protein
MIFDSLVTQNGNVNSYNKKHLWTKKATGLGISSLCSGSWPGFA